MKALKIESSPTLRGEIRVPGDKSISHRAVMLSAISEGSSVLRGLLMGEDVLATIRCFQDLGVKIQLQKDQVVVEGVGLKGLKPPDKVLDCGNSGTTLRLLMGLLAAQPFTSRLAGDASLNRRPMGRVAEPLRRMGAELEELRSSETERVIRISGRPLRGVRYELPVASAQVKSAILLAGLYASGQTEVVETIPSRDHTERLLQQKGAELRVSGDSIKLSPPHHLQAGPLEIPGDISSAAFFLVGGAIAKDSRVKITRVGVNPTRIGILEVLVAMGAQLKVQGAGEAGGEPVADLEIESSSLGSTEIGGALIPRLIDEIPALMVAAAAAQGKTIVRDAAELRVKESDRIAALERELKKLGVQVLALPDGLEVEGPARFKSATFQSGGDHRIAMSLAIAATQGPGSSRIEDVECIATSYPEFINHLRILGGKVEAEA